jgi:hypothetical protein
VHGTNFAGIIREYARRPQGIAEVVAPVLELGGEAAVDGQHAVTKGVIDGDQM